MQFLSKHNRALRAIILFALCAWTVASWFHREPIHRTISPVISTGPASAITSAHDELLPLKALAPIEACVAQKPATMAALSHMLIERGGESLGQRLIWRLVLFSDAKGTQFRLAYRPEKGSPGEPAFRLFSRNEAGNFRAQPLPISTIGQPPSLVFQALLEGKIMLSDVSATHERFASSKEYWVEVENGAVRAVDYAEPGFRLRCSSAYGPANCECSRD